MSDNVARGVPEARSADTTCPETLEPSRREGLTRATRRGFGVLLVGLGLLTGVGKYLSNAMTANDDGIVEETTLGLLFVALGLVAIRYPLSRVSIRALGLASLVGGIASIQIGRAAWGLVLLASGLVVIAFPRSKVSIPVLGLAVLAGGIVWMQPYPATEFEPWVAPENPCPYHSKDPSWWDAYHYVEVQPDFAGQWGEECAMVWGFAGDLAKHETALASIGFDLSSDEYRLVQVEYSLAELYEIHDAVYSDWDFLKEEWGLLNNRVTAAWNAVWLWVDWTDTQKLEDFREHLSDQYGYEGWVIDTGREPPTGEQI
ncbi:MAG: DUF308 domain-containing protein [bacterium]|nr:DUF308 domain-containing protein [bacterium]